MGERHLGGGGVDGCFVALRLAEIYGGAKVAIAERETDLLLRASYNNQARVHHGYHYPRSVLTALRSSVNAPRFMAEFRDAISSDFQHYYAIARQRSNITPGQFEQFCRRIGASLQPARGAIGTLFEPDLIDAVYAVAEPAFDADKLRESLHARLRKAGVKLSLGREALKVTSRASGDGGLRVTLRDLASGPVETCDCSQLYNCTFPS